jgi:dephospho-CoA kinase
MKALNEFQEELDKILESHTTETEELNEKLITFGGKAYPKFGNAVLLAGGAGSGKGFVLSNLLGIEGQVYDVDEVKKLALKSEKIKKLAKDATGKDISKFNLKNPDDVSTLHTILDEELNIIDKRKLARFVSIMVAPEDRKPNLIFDVTLKSLNKLRSITADIEKLGYSKLATHLVWVINSYNVAIQQNRERDRRVPEEILMDTHRGAAQTAKDILDMGKGIDKYLDGDIWYAFNKRGVDSTVAKSDKGGSYIKDANYIKVKEAGKAIDKKKVTDEVVKKIAGYVPPSNYWG